MVILKFLPVEEETKIIAHTHIYLSYEFWQNPAILKEPQTRREVTFCY